MSGEANRRAKAGRTSAASGTGRGKGRGGKQSFAGPKEPTPTPAIGADSARPGPPVDDAKIFSEKLDVTATAEAIVEEAVEAATRTLELDIFPPVRSFVERAKAEFPQLYAEAFAQWCLALRAYCGADSVNLADEEYWIGQMIECLAAGVPPSTLAKLGPELWAKFQTREETDLKFLEKTSRAKIAGLKRQGEDKMSFAERLVKVWWEGGFWLMTEMSAYHAFLAIFGASYCRKERTVSAETIRVEANRRKLPRCSAMGEKALVAVSFDGKLSGAGRWAQGT